jgi:hypothetical protein
VVACFHQLLGVCFVCCNLLSGFGLGCVLVVQKVTNSYKDTKEIELRKTLTLPFNICTVSPIDYTCYDIA